MEEYKELGPLLCLDNVEMAYGDNTVLKDINLIEKDVVRPGKVTGQIIAVVGKSGCGKSTLFKALTGLKSPKSGSVLIPNFDEEGGIGEAKEVSEGDVGFVDQHYTLFRHKTVKQILLYSLRRSTLSKESKIETINKHLTDWGLINEINKYPNELSGGQRQRVAILEQLLSDSRFFVLDEPTSGLDVPSIENVKKALRFIRDSDEYKTIIFSSHLLEFAVEVADVIYYLGKPKGKSYSTIIKKFDLKELGLAWQDKFTEEHQKVVSKIKDLMLNE